MSHTRKYISTIVDGNPACLGLSKCNLCPYFNLNVRKKESYCLKNNSFIQKIYSYMLFNGYHFALNNVEIPYWCELSFDFFSNLNTKNVYYKKNSDIIIEEKDIISKDIIDDVDVEYDDDKLVKCKKAKIKKETTIKPTNICSCCGEEKDDVDRYKNMGMCNDCWNSFKVDEDKDNFVFINNFRLKRNSTFSKEKFKKIKINSDN